MSKSQKAVFLFKMTVKKWLQKGYKAVTFCVGTVNLHFLTFNLCNPTKLHKVAGHIACTILFYTKKVGDLFINSLKNNIKEKQENLIFLLIRLWGIDFFGRIML